MGDTHPSQLGVLCIFLPGLGPGRDNNLKRHALPGSRSSGSLLPLSGLPVKKLLEKVLTAATSQGATLLPRDSHAPPVG